MKFFKRAADSEKPSQWPSPSPSSSPKAIKPTEKPEKQSFFKNYVWVWRRWPKKARKATYWLMPCELAGMVPCLVLFGIAQPDLFRTAMWEIGWEYRLNSNPAIILYAYANHTPKPHIAFIWSETLTDFNVAIAVMSLFFLLAKLIANIMKVWFPLLAVFINIAMSTLYAVSVWGQVGVDYTDPRYPAPAAWYYRYGCDLAKPFGKVHYCKLSQLSIIPTAFMLCVYLANLGVALWAMWPNARNDAVYDDDDDDAGSTASDPKEGRVMEMHDMKGPMTPRTVPFTPRTQAFHQLDRRLPLRSQQQQQQQQQTRFA